MTLFHIVALLLIYLSYFSPHSFVSSNQFQFENEVAEVEIDRAASLINVDDSSSNNFYLSSCNGKAVVRRKNIMKSPPAPAIPPEASFSIQINSDYITGYRFRNPSGMRFDGICSNNDLENGVIAYPGPASAEFTWFEGNLLNQCKISYVYILFYHSLIIKIDRLFMEAHIHGRMQH